MENHIGKQSLSFENRMPYISMAASVVGKKESEGPLASWFDRTSDNDEYGENTWEDAESAMQKIACDILLEKSSMDKEQIQMIFGGDLQRQTMATTMGVKEYKIPFWGLYGACSTIGEAIGLAAICISGGFAEKTIAVTSSHFASAEKEFRFPLGYASQRNLSASWTVTGSGALLISKEKSHVAIRGMTIGKIVDFGLKDSQNMGACMAPAAMDTISQNLEDFQWSMEDYDKVITGDLGSVGQSILMDLGEIEQIDLKEKHLDCGMLIYDSKTQHTNAGGSGCGCAAVTLASYILPKIEKGEWKRVLFVPTGALLSTVSYYEGKTIPGIAHGIVLEYVE